MTGAYVTLAGCYFLSFILAGRGRFGWLSAAFATATVGHLAVVLWPGWALSPIEDAAAVLGSTVLLQVLLLTALFGVVGQVRAAELALVPAPGADQERSASRVNIAMRYMPNTTCATRARRAPANGSPASGQRSTASPVPG